MVVLGLVLLIVEQDPRAVVRIAEVLGVASLFFWGAFAARRSGLARRRQWQWGTIYGLLGGGIILIELAFTH